MALQRHDFAKHRSRASQDRRQGGGIAHAPPKSQKGPPDGIVKHLKWYKTNVVVVGLTI